MQDGILILLNAHLGILSEGFALPKPPGVAAQFDLFPATPVGEAAKPTAPLIVRTAAERRWRSA